MKKNILAGILAFVFIVGAVHAAPTSALTVDEIQVQIKELLAKVADLQVQLRTAAGGQTEPVDPTTSMMPRHRICSILARNLSQGARGDDVQGLQEFLHTEGYLSANATGYFGPMTAQAVAKWQASEGVSAVGAFGPMSRERIRIWCGNGGIPNQRFSATPQRGEPPLVVTFSTWISGFHPASDTYTIEFGDGSSEVATGCYAPTDYCQSPGQNKHTYTSTGTYTATLVHTSNPCMENPQCMAPVSREVIGKLQIQVGPVSCTKEYAPVCGSKPIVCITTPCNPIPQTYSNRCMMQADGATYLYGGVCRDDSGNKPPTISSFSGPTTLNTNQTGTWTVKASDPENGTLSYKISWGDEPSYAVRVANGYLDEFVQTTTFTHSYSLPDTYVIGILVRDNEGQETIMSSTVRVGDAQTYCTKEYAPVCGQPPEPACRHSIPACMIATPGPQTYGNRCMLSAAGATLLYSGQCSSAY